MDPSTSARKVKRGSFSKSRLHNSFDGIAADSGYGSFHDIRRSFLYSTPDANFNKSLFDNDQSTIDGSFIASSRKRKSPKSLWGTLRKKIINEREICGSAVIETEEHSESFQDENVNLTNCKPSKELDSANLSLCFSEPPSIIGHERSPLGISQITPDSKSNYQSCKALYQKKRRIFSTPLVRNAKRKLDIPENKSTDSKKFYNGITHLSIIEKLVSYSLILDKIFGLLTDEDLSNLTLVCSSWRDAVFFNSRARNRLDDYRTQAAKSKENCQQQVKEVKKVNVSVPTEKEKKTPFSTCNSAGEDPKQEANKQAVLSPSKRRFLENQKIVQTLAHNEKLVKCPRCANFSRILDSQSPQKSSKTNLFATYSHPLMNTQSDLSNNQYDKSQNHFSLHQHHTWSHSSQKYSSFIEPLPEAGSALASSSLSLSPHKTTTSTCSVSPRTPSKFGQCSGLKCQFKFCLKCFCEYHGKSTCKVSKQISPSKEDVENGILEVVTVPIGRSKRTKHKSLKRLCF